MAPASVPDRARPRRKLFQMREGFQNFAIVFSLVIAYAVMWIGTKLVQPQLRRLLDAIRIS